jgi:hypothetical protein
MPSGNPAALTSLARRARRNKANASFLLTITFHIEVFIFFWGGGSATPCAFPPPRPSIFSDYLFSKPPCYAMASDFSVTLQLLSKRIIVFFNTDQTPHQKSSSYIDRLYLERPLTNR